MDSLEQELAKAAGQIVVDTAKDTRAAIGTLFGDALREYGRTLGDQARLYRFENLVRIMDRVNKICRERGLSADQLKALPFGDAFRVMEAASVEEEDEVQELWARLIANAADPETMLVIKKVHVDLLKSLSPAEAVFIDLIWGFDRVEFANLEDLAKYNKESELSFETRWRKYDLDDRKIAIQNLIRLRCVTIRQEPVFANNLLGRVPRELRRSSFEDWAFVDARKFGPFVEKLLDQISIAVGSKEYEPSQGVKLSHRGFYQAGGGPRIEAPELNYVLTSLGRGLMAACQIKDGEVSEAAAT